jgi:hypothetical protein
VSETEQTVPALLNAASEHIRQAVHAGPPDPGELYDTIGVLHELAARLDQPLQSCAEALRVASLDPRLSSDDGEDPAVLARTAALRGDRARSRLTGLVAELGVAHSEVSHLRIPTSDQETTRG